MTKALLVKTDVGYFMPVDDTLKNIQPGEVIEVELGKPQQRTSLQNNALHLYFRNASTSLNDAGFTVAKTLNKGLEMPWTEILFEQLIWKPVQLAQLGKKSTTQLTKHEVSNVYDIINLHLSTTRKIHIAFPSRETFNDK
tara:strand:+ start:157 stop:576 length:420 start_codon:yes stop_codon:yes gene_type:complete